MVNSCSANGCKNKNTKGCNLTFHRFPLNNKHMLKLWLYQIKRGTWEPSKYSVICSAHFTEDSFIIKGPQNRRTLKNDACPTIFTVANYTELKKKKGPKVADVTMEDDEKQENMEETSEEKDAPKIEEKPDENGSSVEKENPEENGSSVEKENPEENDSAVEKEESS